MLVSGRCTREDSFASSFLPHEVSKDDDGCEAAATHDRKAFA